MSTKKHTADKNGGHPDRESDLPRPEPRKSLREHALEVIRHAITTGDLAEHTIYSAAGLAKKLAISLSPVREAMMSLVAEGTVEAVPNRGFRLVPVTTADLEEIFHIRSLLAGPAVEELCRRTTGFEDDGVWVQVGVLRDLAAKAVGFAEEGDSVGFMDVDRRFHEHLLCFGLGRRAAAISLRLRDQSRVFGESRDSVDLDSARQLVALVELIVEGESDAARELVIDNLHYFHKVGCTETGCHCGGSE